MKTINITKKRAVENLYSFQLGNGERISFTSKRIANKFIADTNRFLTKCLVVLNTTYIELFREYRLMWFVTSNTNQGSKVYYGSVEQDIKRSLQAADDIFTKFNHSAWGSNDPYFAFIDLKKIALFLNDAAGPLCEFHKKRNTTASYYACIVLSDRLESILEKLQSYTYVK